MVMKTKDFMMNKKKIFPAALVAYIVAMIAIMVACKKDPIPGSEPEPEPTSDTITPVIPGDTITPITPNDTIVPTPGDTIVPTPPTPGGDTLQPGNWDTIPGRKITFSIVKPGDQGIRYPTLDTIRYYANHPGCDSILLKWRVPPNVTVGWTPGIFNVAFDSLEARFILTNKAYGDGNVMVNQNYGGASIPCEELLTHSKLGMTLCDSIRCANWGYKPMRDPYSKSRADNINFINTIGMGRSILGGKQH